jgi:integrase
VTIKYLEPDFTELFLNGLRGLAPDGVLDSGYRGRELARNAAIGELALATGLRLQEFSYLLAYEVPVLPPKPAGVPIPFRVPAGVAKGRKFRTTWITYEALAAVHDYLGLDRAAATDGSPWRPPTGWGEPLLVTDPDAEGGRMNGIRRPWDLLTPGERRRLVAPGGGSCLIAVRAGGGPFTAWPTVFDRTADRIRGTSEPRFPHVHPHRLRHILSALFLCCDGHDEPASGTATFAPGYLFLAAAFAEPRVPRERTHSPANCNTNPLHTASAGRRHTFAIRTLEQLVSGHYRQAARLAADTGPDAALAFYLSKADPLLVLRDLLGHSSVLTTEKYLRRLDTTRIYREAHERAGVADWLLGDADAEREADEEFAGRGPEGGD